MSTLGKKTRTRRTQGTAINSTWACEYCTGNRKGDHARKCPIWKREFLFRLENRITWWRESLCLETDRKERNKLIARIARTEKRIAYWRGVTFDRVGHDRRQSMGALDALAKLGQNKS